MKEHEEQSLFMADNLLRANIELTRQLSSISEQLIHLCKDAVYLNNKLLSRKDSEAINPYGVEGEFKPWTNDG